ncbi:MAG: hypothetical protein NW201_02445 [Gemmatimonadales bacterium]|nr:hypothetical protein [Gemmatimonadales bacterium]
MERDAASRRAALCAIRDVARRHALARDDAAWADAGWRAVTVPADDGEPLAAWHRPAADGHPLPGGGALSVEGDVLLVAEWSALPAAPWRVVALARRGPAWSLRPAEGAVRLVAQAREAPGDGAEGPR